MGGGVESMFPTPLSPNYPNFSPTPPPSSRSQPSWGTDKKHVKVLCFSVSLKAMAMEYLISVSEETSRRHYSTLCSYLGDTFI